MTNEQISVIFEKHADTVYRVCFAYFKGDTMGAEDAVQTVFLNMIKYKKRFENEQHEKAWLIVAASNVCKNMLRRKSRELTQFKDNYQNSPKIVDDTLGIILELPQNYKMSIYLFYYEGYSAKEIGKMLSRKQSTIWKYLKVGRDMLKSKLTEEMS